MQSLWPIAPARRFFTADATDEPADLPELIARLASLADTTGTRTVLQLASGSEQVRRALVEHDFTVDRLDDVSDPDELDRIGRPAPVQDGGGASGRYAIALITDDDLGALGSQEAQVRGVRDAAARLEPRGWLVVEATVPTFLYEVRRSSAADVDPDDRWPDVTRHDPVEQIVEERQVAFSPSGIRLHTTVSRYVWPGELDLMARLAGLVRQHRWGGWDGRPFGTGSDTGISVYRRVAG